MIDEVVILAGLIAWFLHAHFIPYRVLLHCFEGTCQMSHWFFLSIHPSSDAKDTHPSPCSFLYHVCAYFFSHNALDEFLSLSSILVLFITCQKYSPPALLLQNG